jgi:hypothetical protein
LKKKIFEGEVNVIFFQKSINPHIYRIKTVIVLFYILNKKIVFNASDLIFRPQQKTVIVRYLFQSEYTKQKFSQKAKIATLTMR